MGCLIPPEDVCDRVFGPETKDGPSLRDDTRVTSSIKRPWEDWFDAERPDWYPDFPRYYPE